MRKLLILLLYFIYSCILLNAQWAISYGGSGDDNAYSIQQTSDGGYIVAGSYGQTWKWPGEFNIMYKESNPLGDVSKGGLGYIGKTGSYVNVSGGLLVDLYVNYSYCKIKPADFEINIGGIEAGGSIGYQF
jgi:hypothetical protein